MTDFDFKRDFIPTMLKRPHVVILGAGASLATIIEGDKNGRKLSVMNNFIAELGMDKTLANIDLQTTSNNLEDIYSELNERTDCENVREELENRIRAYFEELEITNEPTIYDYLLLSLRGKDLIASFNWDDLLIQAYNRVNNITKDLPRIVFLHGNISVGYCPTHDNSIGYIGRECDRCGSQLYPSQLLFPVKKKDYNNDPHLAVQWEVFKDSIEQAAILTIFGYGAPDSDVEAKKILLDAFHHFGSDKRPYDTIEIIDKPGLDRSILYDKWSDFINTVNGHIKIRGSFFDSFSAKEPSRSIEWYVKRNYEGCWAGGEYPLSSDLGFEDLKSYLQPLMDNEDSAEVKAM